MTGASMKRCYRQVQLKFPKSRAVSDGRRNTCLQSSCRSLETQGLSGTLIQAQRDLVELRLRDGRQVGSSGEVLSQQEIGVFIGAALPRTLRVAEVHFHVGGHRKLLVPGHLQSAVPRQGAPQACREFTNLPAQGSNALAAATLHRSLLKSTVFPVLSTARYVKAPS